MSKERHGRHRFAKQIGGWGSFAEVEIVVAPANDDCLVLDVGDLSSDPRRDDWIAGLRLGVRYALEHAPESSRDVSVRVVRLQTNPVDSSTLSVAFATCFAVWDGLELSPENPPFFDENSRSFVFPR